MAASYANDIVIIIVNIMKPAILLALQHRNIGKHPYFNFWVRSIDTFGKLSSFIQTFNRAFHLGPYICSNCVGRPKVSFLLSQFAWKRKSDRVTLKLQSEARKFATLIENYNIVAVSNSEKRAEIQSNENKVKGMEI